MRKALVIFTFFSLFAKFSFSQGIDFVHDKKFQEILDMAKAENKLIFIDCYTVWCGPCKRLSANVFPDPEVGNFFNATFINAKIDMEKDEGPTIAGKYGIRAYPTLLWIDSTGNVKHKVVGGLDVAGLIQNGKKAIDPTPGILEGMRKQYAEGNRDADFMNSYLNTLSQSGEKYEDVFKEYLEKLTPQELQESKFTKTIFNLTNDIKSPALPYLVKNRSYYLNLMGDEAYNYKMNRLAEKACNEAPRAGDAALFEAAIELLKSNKAPDAEEKILRLSMDYYSRMNDWINYDKNASQFIKKHASKNAAVLNEVSWNYFLNINDKAQLQKATKWAHEAINIDDKYTYNITYAYLLYKQKIYKEAELACDYAIIRAKEENVLPSSATALKDAIQKTVSKPQ